MSPVKLLHVVVNGRFRVPWVEEKDRAEGSDRGELSIATKNGSTGRMVELLPPGWGSKLFCVYKASH